MPSHDGKTIYGRTPAGKLVAYSFETGTERVLHDDFTRVPNLILSRDGTKLAVRSGTNLGVVDLASGAYTRLYSRDFPTDRNVMWGLDWSTDDQHVVVLAREFPTGRTELWTYPASGGPRVSHRLPTEMLGLSIDQGGMMATVRVEKRPQVWALENFLGR